MSIASRIIQRKLGLDDPVTRKLTVERDLRVPMRDGVELLADRWTPAGGGDGLPTALLRSPYGRAGLLATGMARPLAERGFQVLIQSTRGGFGSGGEMDALRQEREDGLDTLDWLVGQPWSDAIVLVGMSYLGFVQWAVADSLPPQVKAMVTQVTESALTKEFMRPDGVSLELPFEWGVLVGTQERPLAMLRQRSQGKKTEGALRRIPLRNADIDAIGRRSQYIQDVFDHDADDPFWDRLDHRHRVADTRVPVSSIGGWYDIFLPGQLRDFKALQEAGKPASLTVGPWTHAAFTGIGFTEALDFALPLARGEQPADCAPVRLHVMESGGDDTGEWRDFDTWPPKGYEPKRFHLHPGGALAPDAPAESGVDEYRYDPADPTPAFGGISISRGGKVDNTELEARPDVLTYTTPPLDADTEVIGEVEAEIRFRSSLPFADVFVRLCDVDTQGRSWNVCDGLTTVSGADDLTPVAVRLWPTAHRFKQGHRIRVQVSSGAFPRYARNHGTGEPFADAVEMHPADQEVHSTDENPSWITLPTR
jgi:putative CocE/NonD family hydrolase